VLIKNWYLLKGYSANTSLAKLPTKKKRWDVQITSTYWRNYARLEPPIERRAVNDRRAQEQKRMSVQWTRTHQNYSTISCSKFSSDSTCAHIFIIDWQLPVMCDWLCTWFVAVYVLCWFLLLYIRYIFSSISICNKICNSFKLAKVIEGNVDYATLKILLLNCFAGNTGNWNFVDLNLHPVYCKKFKTATKDA